MNVDYDFLPELVPEHKLALFGKYLRKLGKEAAHKKAEEDAAFFEKVIRCLVELLVEKYTKENDKNPEKKAWAKAWEFCEKCAGQTWEFPTLEEQKKWAASRNEK